MELNHVNRNQLCNDLNFKYTTVSDWINGITFPRIGRLELLARYFSIDKSKLIEDHLTDCEEKKMSEKISILAKEASDLTDDQIDLLRMMIKQLKADPN